MYYAKADELTFDEGDLIYVQSQADDGWWKAKTATGEAGLVPANYIQESSESVVNPLHEAAKRGNTPYLEECLSNGVSPNGLDKAGSTPLHWAARGGHIECVDILLSLPNIHVNVTNKMGDTPLHGAAWKGNAAVVAKLLEKGADRNIKNNEEETPYDLAKDPATGRLLMRRLGGSRADEEYGESEEEEGPE
eukprot:UC1_evm1s219